MGIRITGTGCCLMDYLYTDMDFSGAAFRRFSSKKPGDGGLTPGALVFAEHLEVFAGVPFAEVLLQLTGGREPDANNIGGPVIVALAHVAQLLHNRDIRVEFRAGRGDDEAGRRMVELIGRTPVNIDGYRIVPGRSPSTVVLSDPGYYGGKGERTFVNTIGAAGNYRPEDLGADFYEADVLVFGATALVPRLHDELTSLLERGKAAGALTVVTTVYDFRNEERAPGAPWPLGDSRRSFPLIDLLVCDREEALKISGCDDIVPAMDHFIRGGVGSVVVTHGAKCIHLRSGGGLFTSLPAMTLPVSGAVDRDLARPDRPKGDTTGCGDNFAGGVLVSLALQLGGGQREGLDLKEACAWGACSGGFSCFYPGGLYQERWPGEKFQAVSGYYEEYRRQVGMVP
jgi:sugar/nucleoside kinase (ribokinase family)